MIKQLVVAFDVDDTLIVPSVATGFDVDVPNYDTLAVYRWFEQQDAYMIVWSGGGAEYAQRWCDRLGLYPDMVVAKTTQMKDEIDIAFDDSDIDLAKVNVKVRRVNNSISRKEWNRHES